MRGLYAIADVATIVARGLSPIAFAEAVLSVPPAALQLRAKDASADETVALLLELAPMCRSAGVPLVANDRPDLAVLAGCDWVHLGQDDMPIEHARRLAPGLGVGVSTHTVEQLEAALAARPVYVAYGPVFDTSTKKDAASVVGLVGLRVAYACAAAAGVPLVAIGGITHARALSLVGVADAIAVIADLLPAAVVPGDRRATRDALSDVVGRARELHAMFAPTLPSS